MNIIDTMDRFVRPLRARVANMVARGVLKLVDDAVKLQSAQINLLSGETREDVERFQNYGFTSVPLAGAEAVVLFVGGRRDHGLAIAVDDRRYRLRNLESGEVAVYSDQGDTIIIRRGGTIEVTASTKVVVSAPTAEFSGNVTIGGSLTASGDVSDSSGSMSEMRTTYNGHTHPVTTAPGVTAPPSSPMT